MNIRIESGPGKYFRVIRTGRRAASLVLLLALLFASPAGMARGAAEAPAPAQPNCRYGITSLNKAGVIDLQALRIGAFLDWGAQNRTVLPAGVDYIHVLRVGDRCYSSKMEPVDCKLTAGGISPYQKTLASLESLVAANQGGYWVVGNEPDTSYENQDDLTAEEYAARFFTLASQIRRMDATAHIGFGSIVQPSPIRMRYLARAWTSLVSLSGSARAASGLIDFWTIHAFILNETPGEWGTGVPLGFEKDFADAFAISDLSQTLSTDLFGSRLKIFRTWMKGIGERSKPLWITEYGSLLPPLDPPGGPDLENVSDAKTRDYMLNTFNFLENASDSLNGLATDHNRLVQRWFWYSLNDYRWNFGGSLFDPSSSPPVKTSIGTAFNDYLPKREVTPEFHFVGKPSFQVNRKDKSVVSLTLQISNAGSSVRSSPRMWIYVGHPDGTLAAEIDLAAVMGCGESQRETISLPAGDSLLYLRLDTNADLLPDAGDEVMPLNLAYNRIN